MALKFPSGGVLHGSCGYEPSWLLNVNGELYSTKRDNRFFKIPEPSLKKISCKCQICGRSHGRPRKNKEFVDENRGVTVETGVKTVVKKMDLNVFDQAPHDKISLLLCQGCIYRIEIEEACYIKKPAIGLIRLRYAPTDMPFPFLRKNEVITEEFIQVSIKGESEKYQFYEEPHYFKGHFPDAFDYALFNRMNEELEKMQRQQYNNAFSGRNLLGFGLRRFEEEYDNIPICLPSSPVVESAAYVSQDEFVIAARGCGKTFDDMKFPIDTLVKPKSTKKVRKEPFWKRFERRSKKRF